MFDAKYGSAPAYLAGLYKVRTDEQLRSTSRRHFVIPRTRTRTADSAFIVAAPTAWNALPSELRTVTSKTIFHNRLKTYLFFLLNYLLSTLSTLVNIVTLNRVLTF